MRERLFRVIHALEKNDWHADSKLMIALREIAENSDKNAIEEVFEAFR